MSYRENSEKQPLAQKQATPDHLEGHGDLGFFLRHINVIARVCGLAVLAVIWAATVTSLQGKTDAPIYIAYYLLATSLFVTFFEVTWVLDKMVCCVRQGYCCKCWAIVLWVDTWRKFIIYSAISVPLFLQGLKAILDIISGFCLLVLGCLYLVKSFSSSRRKRQEHEPVPDSNREPIVRLETGTQTDDISIEQAQAPATNPFEMGTYSEEETHSGVQGSDETEKMSPEQMSDNLG